MEEQDAEIVISLRGDGDLVEKRLRRLCIAAVV